MLVETYLRGMNRHQLNEVTHAVLCATINDLYLPLMQHCFTAVKNEPLDTSLFIELTTDLQLNFHQIIWMPFE